MMMDRSAEVGAPEWAQIRVISRGRRAAGTPTPSPPRPADPVVAFRGQPWPLAGIQGPFLAVCHAACQRFLTAGNERREGH